MWTERTEAKPGHGARGVGGGADGFIVGGAEKPFDVYSRHERQRRSSGTRTMSAKKREKKKKKREPGTIYMQPCALWPLDAAQEAAGASLAPTRQLGKPTTSSRFGCLLLRTGEF